MDLRDQLQSALGDAYTLQQELGGGGMSRVFVARDASLERSVVIKVLAPELAAGLSAERFTREIKVTAALQEPHIVPVLAAGVTAEGLPYYSMPFVRGETLRVRMDAGNVSRDEALSLLRDVATALEYAHGHGVVHRDIKPENILRSGRTAVVTDFGIAKALSESRTTSASPLTQAGTSLGTPAYMAPEQVSGDDVDQRADLYSWGVIAYELLAGRHPFAGKTSAQQLMAAHITETPAPLGEVAPGLSNAVTAIVMRTLAKNPADRPANAGELVSALAASTPGEQGGARRGRIIRKRAFAVTACALIALAAGGWLFTPASLRAMARTLLTRAPASFVVNRVVVAPFADESHDPRLASLGQLAADYLTTGLSRLSSLEVVDSRTAMVTSEVVRRIPRVLRANDTRSLGEESGAKVVVAGRYYTLGDSLYLVVRVVDAETGSTRLVLDPVSGLASAPQAVVAVATTRVVAALRAASDRQLSGIVFAPPPSLDAFAAYRQAMSALLKDDYNVSDTAVFNPLARARALDRTWPTPALTTAWLAYRKWEFARADTALAAVAALRDRLSAPDAAAYDGLEAMARGDVRGMFAAAREARYPLVSPRFALTARRPRDAIALADLEGPDRGLNLALSGDYWALLAIARMQLGEYDRAVDAARAGLRRNPRQADIDEMQVLVLAAKGDVAAVRSVLEPRVRTGAVSARWAVFLTTLLRTRGNHDAEGAALMAEWAPQLMARTTPDSAVSCATACWVLASTGQWPEMLRQLDASAAQADEFFRKATGSEVQYASRMRQAYRAVALLHTGRRAEALAIDSVLARSGSERWNLGSTDAARAMIAAHDGDGDRAIALLQRSLDSGLIAWWRLDYRKLAVDGDPFLLPLRADSRFQALMRPDPADGK